MLDERNEDQEFNEREEKVLNGTVDKMLIMKRKTEVGRVDDEDEA